MAILHKNISAEGDIHNPKWFSGANNGDVAWRNELGVLESTDELVLPAALDFVDGSAAPPTSNSGDIYVLSSGASVNAGWGTVSLGDWVRYDGTTWNVITPQKSSLCYNETTDALNSYDGSTWSAIGSGGGGGGSIYTADGTLTGNRTVSLDGNDLTFNLGSGVGGFTVDGSLTTGATAIVNFKGVGVNNALAMGDTGFLANQGITNQSVLSLLNTSNQGIKIKGSYSGIYSSFTEFKKSTTTSNTRLGHFLNNTRAETQYYNSSDDLVHHITLGSPFACSFFRNGVVGGFVVGSNAVIGTEDISLQGSTLIKGNGTSTGSALAIYDNDTTPNKVFEVLDDSTIKTNGNAGFTGTGNYTTFTIENGIITNAS